MRVNFVLSALMSYTRLLRIQEYVDIFQLIDRTFQFIEKENQYIKLNILYNALTERNEIEEHQKGNYKIYLDSGGLQMITRNLNIKDLEAEKLKVYEYQAKYGDYGFSFDKIPRVKLYETNVVGDVNAYAVLADKFYESGLEASKNLQDQIQCFRKADTQCKILPIIQIHSIKEGYEYLQGLTENISPSDMDLFGGIAFGASQGEGYLYLLKFAGLLQKDNFLLEKQRELVHFLGVGSLLRTLALCFMYRRGLLRTETLSLDSSAIMKYLDSGKFHYYDNGYKKVEKIGKDYHVNYRYYKYVYEYFEPFLKEYYTSYDNFFDYHYFCGKTALKLREEKDIKSQIQKYGSEEVVKYILFRYFSIMYFVAVLVTMVEKLLEGEISIHSITKNKKLIKEINLIENLSPETDLEYILNRYYREKQKTVCVNQVNCLENW